MFALSFNKPTAKNLAYLFIAAFLIRASVFYFYIQHQERYFQPDSNDYHNSALSIGLGYGMTKLNNGQPIFWRTPGYPLYLSWFYKYFGIKSGTFSDNMPAEKASLWVQILLTSVIPIIIFFLALSLTGVLSIAWITAWISVIHLGLILASTFFLTEGLTLIFFYLFLIFFYKSFQSYGDPGFDYPGLQARQSTPGKNSLNKNRWKLNLVIAALMLAIATWIRPMGQFVALASIILMLIVSQDSWRLKAQKALLFLLVFFAAISPWYIRNYKLTGKVFFCPMFGLYLNTFIAPKILRSIHGGSFEQHWRHQQGVAQQKAMKELPNALKTKKFLVLEDISGSVAWPLVTQHPWYTFTAWMPEVIKSSFDLYSYQLVAIANECWKWDPLEEFLGEKMVACLHKGSIPTPIRLVSWIEFAFSCFLWVSLLIGAWKFLLHPMLARFKVAPTTQHTCALWFKAAFLIGSILFMTGGFGYARLRLPVEPLIIILALTVWLPRKRTIEQ